MIKYGFKLPKSVKNVFYAAFTMFFPESKKATPSQEWLSLKYL